MIATIGPKTLGLRIRQLRTQRMLTQQDLAGEDYSKSYISAIEQGKTRPSLQALQRIAGRLEVPASTLLDLDVPGFAPEAHELIPTRVRHPRGARSVQGQGVLSSDPALTLTRAEMLVRTRQAQAAHELLKTVIGDYTSYATQDPQMGEDSPVQGEGPVLPSLTSVQAQKGYYLAALSLVELENVGGAIRCAQRAMKAAQEQGDREGLEQLRNLLGELYFKDRQPLLALEQHRQCLEAVGGGLMLDPNFKLRVCWNLATDYRALRDQENTAAMYRVAADLGADLAGIEEQATAYSNTATAYLEAGERRAAENATAVSAATQRVLANLHVAMHANKDYGTALVAGGDIGGAELYLLRALELARQLHDRVQESLVLTQLARADLRRGDLQDAERKAAASLDLARTGYEGGGDAPIPANAAGGSLPVAIGVTRDSAETALSSALAVAGDVAAESGDEQATDRLFMEAIGLLESSGVLDAAPAIYERYARILSGRGQHKEAARYFESAYRAVTGADQNTPASLE